MNPLQPFARSALAGALLGLALAGIVSGPGHVVRAPVIEKWKPVSSVESRPRLLAARESVLSTTRVAVEPLEPPELREGALQRRCPPCEP